MPFEVAILKIRGKKRDNNCILLKLNAVLILFTTVNRKEYICYLNMKKIYLYLAIIEKTSRYRILFIRDKPICQSVREETLYNVRSSYAYQMGGGKGAESQAESVSFRKSFRQIFPKYFKVSLLC